MQNESRVDPKIIEEILKFSKNVIEAPNLVSAPDEISLEVTQHDIVQVADFFSGGYHLFDRFHDIRIVGKRLREPSSLRHMGHNISNKKLEMPVIESVSGHFQRFDKRHLTFHQIA